MMGGQENIYSNPANPAKKSQCQVVKKYDWDFNHFYSLYLWHTLNAYLLYKQQQ
jgi:hypothetical protein